MRVDYRVSCHSKDNKKCYTVRSESANQHVKVVNGNVQNTIYPNQVVGEVIAENLSKGGAYAVAAIYAAEATAAGYDGYIASPQNPIPTI